MKTSRTEKKRRKGWIFWAILAVLLALAVTAVGVLLAYLGQVERLSDLSGDLMVNEDLPTEGVRNIALFGLDSRQDTETGHSDAIIILSLDYTNDKIKMTSLARDSLVTIDGYGMSKLTNAFWWGGMELAVKTINQNFGMNITDYVYVNFFEFAGIIDYIGGVTLDVSEDEMRVMNTHYISWIQSYGIACEPIAQPGVQKVNGGQALAYARNRYTGTDIDRGNRQKEVLEAMYARIKETPLSKMPELIRRVLGMCHTNLSNREMLEIGSWAVFRQPSFAPFSLPSPECHAEMGDRGDGYGDVVRYDMSFAAEILREFVYEEPGETDTTE